MNKSFNVVQKRIRATSKFFPTLQSYCSRLSVSLLSTLIRLDRRKNLVGICVSRGSSRIELLITSNRLSCFQNSTDSLQKKVSLAIGISVEPGNNMGHRYNYFDDHSQRTSLVLSIGLPKPYTDIYK